MSTFRVDVATTDTDEATAFFNDMYSGIDMDPHVTEFSFSASAAGDERFSCMRDEWSATGTMHSAPQRLISVIELTEGTWDSQLGRTQLDTTRPCLFPTVASTARWEGPFGVLGTQMDAAVLNASAAEHFGVPGLRVNFTGSAPISLQLERAWRTMTKFVRANVLAGEDLLQNDLIRNNAFDLITAGLLVTFPNNTLDLPAARDGTSAVPASIRRAIAYMEEHVAEPIRLEDIAAACRLSPRGLQDAFIRVLGTSPMTYLRRIRLESVHADLLRADPTSGDTVAAIARAWGFAHRARFSASYKDEYGEYPADTLRR